MTPLATAATAGLVFVLVLHATSASAAFQSSPGAPVGYGSSTLQPAGPVTATCSPAPGNNNTATVTWALSPSSYTTGYLITFTGGSTTATSSPATITGLRNRSYTFKVTATFGNWTSAESSSPAVNC